MRTWNVACIRIRFSYPHYHRHFHQLDISPCVSNSLLISYCSFSRVKSTCLFRFQKVIYDENSFKPIFSNEVKKTQFDVSNKKIGLLLSNELINKSALGRSYWTRPSESGPGMEVPVPGNVSICHKQQCSAVWPLAGTATRLGDTSVIIKCIDSEVTATESTIKTESFCTVLTEWNIEVLLLIMSYKSC